jgi:hypothetical protein
VHRGNVRVHRNKADRSVHRDRTKNRTTIRNRNVNKTVIKENNRAERRNASRGKRIHFSNRQRVRARDYYRHHRDRFHRVARVTWPIVIGGYVPRDYTVYDIPDDYYGYVPGYEGYKYIVVGDQLLIIDPETWEIVAIIPI